MLVSRPTTRATMGPRLAHSATQVTMATGVSTEQLRVTRATN
jgi:hypothetical protein